MSEEIITMEERTHLVHDQLSGRYFKSTISQIERAFAYLARIIDQEGYASVNDLYVQLGLSEITLGENLGWNQAIPDPRFGALVAPDQSPAITFWVVPGPWSGYDNG